MIEKVKERQENELVNNAEYGLVNNVAPEFKVKTRKGAPTPDDLDELIARVWKEPSFFLANPRAIAAFGRECTRRGVPPATVNLFGSQFMTWRGIPLVPSDKLAIKAEKTNILLLRTGEKKQGSSRPVPTGTARRGFAQFVRALHGHQPQGDRLVLDLALLLDRSSDGRRNRGTGERECRPIPRVQVIA